MHPSYLAQASHRRSLMAGILSAACWGWGTVLSKGLLEQIPPLPLLSAQLIGSVTFLWMAIAIRQQFPPLKWQVLRLGLSGALEPGLAYLFGMTGLTMTTASSASLIGVMEPILVMILAGLLLGERMTLQMMGVVSLALVGTGLIVGADPIAHSGGSLLGNLLILLSTFCAAAYVVLTRRLVVTLNPLPLVALQQTFGLFLVLSFWAIAPSSGASQPWMSVSPMIWIATLASGVIQYALSFWLYLTALRRIQANMTTLFLMLIPVFGISGASLFLGEQLTVMQWAGTCVILISMTWLPRLQKQPPEPSDVP